MDHSLHSSKVFDRHADLYQSEFMDVSAYHEGLDNFLQLLPGKHPSILEIGCGPGNLAHYLLRKKENIRIHGIDLAPNMIRLARINCPEATFEVADCRNIDRLSQKYNGVVAGFCLPYLNKAETATLLENIYRLLTDKGVLYVSTIEGDYAASGIKKASTGDEVFMYYYRTGELEELLTQSGFKLITAQKVVVDSNPHKDIDIVLIAGKQDSL